MRLLWFVMFAQMPMTNSTNHREKQNTVPTHKVVSNYFSMPQQMLTRLHPNENIVTKYKLDDITISLVGYHQFENPDITNVLQAIQEEKAQGNFIIFFPHWGNEYEKKASDIQKEIARKVVQAGADIVIGAHPHVIQNVETHDSKPIFYSLGNFVFDQWFSEDVKYGLALLLTFSERNIESIELKPFYRARYHPKWLIGEERTNWCTLYTQGTLFTYKQENPCLLTLN